MPLVVITPLDEEPVTLDEIKGQCRVDLDEADQDELLWRHAVSARQWIEQITGRALAEQTFELVLDRFPGGCTRVHESGRITGPFIYLPRTPLIDVVSITYIDDTGASQTMDSADYIVDTDSVPARVTPAYDEVWPTTQFRINAVRVRFRAGYANDSPTPEYLPEPLKDALLLRIQELYDGVDFGKTIDALIEPYRIRRF